MDAQNRAAKLLENAQNHVFWFVNALKVGGNEVLGEIRDNIGYKGPNAEAMRKAAQEAWDHERSLIWSTDMNDLASITRVYNRASMIFLDLVNAADRASGETPGFGHYFNYYHSWAKLLQRREKEAYDALIDAQRYSGDPAPLSSTVGSECSTCSVCKAIGHGDVSGLPFCSKACMEAHH